MASRTGSAPVASSNAPKSCCVPLSSRMVRARASNRCNRRTKQQLDAPLGVEMGRPKRNPILLRLASKIVFREVRTIDGRIDIGADDRNAAVVPVASQHVGRGQARGATADDENGRWLRE